MTATGFNELLEAATRAHNSGRSQEAVMLYQKALAFSPGNVTALLNFGSLLEQIKQHGQSEILLKQAISLAPRHIDIYVLLSVVLHAQQKFEEAATLCEKGLKISPDNKALRHNLATNLHGAGRNDEAIALLTKEIQAHPSYARGHYFIGNIYDKLGKSVEAVKYYKRASELNRKDILSLVGAGDCLLRTGSAGEAVEQFDKALRLSPYDVRALALKTLALAELGRTEDERWLSDPFRLVQIIRLTDVGYSPEQIVALNRGLSEFASNHPTMREDPPENATYNGWHSGNLTGERNSATDELKKFIAYAFEQRVKALPQEDQAHPFVQSVPRKTSLHLWAVKMLGGSKMTPHIHTSGWLSGVYYVDVPDIVDNPQANEAGWIKFGAPRNDIALTKKTMIRTVKPEPGLMVTFPSYFWHDTVPLPAENKEQRLCLAFDVEPEKGS